MHRSSVECGRREERTSFFACTDATDKSENYSTFSSRHRQAKPRDDAFAYDVVKKLPTLESTKVADSRKNLNTSLSSMQDDKSQTSIVQ